MAETIAIRLALTGDREVQAGLKRVGDAVDQILLADEGHGKGSWWTVSTR
mgnify:CR=1 FL=1